LRTFARRLPACPSAPAALLAGLCGPGSRPCPHRTRSPGSSSSSP